ncbi:hypothetical protein C6496_10285 [Candidatus Poribacteria bacterium]|nr:MAG: hypothetical protein C6496_10285 [Candidatus Poribacteria bacterium]
MNPHYSEVVRYTNDALLLTNPLGMKADTVKKSFLLLALVVGVTMCLFLPKAAEARPEFATELGKECSFCHIDPAGGGPRNRVGEIFEENYFEFPEDFDMDAVTEEAKEIVKQLTTSLDLQTAFIKTTHVDGGENAIAGCNSCHSSIDRFLLMQAEVTFNAQASEHVRLTLSNNAGTTMNAFATVDAIPKHLYVKIGQFRLPFAIKQKDHNILVREGYGLGSNKRDVGVELGGTAGRLFYNAAFFNAGNAAAKGGLGTIGAQLGPVRGGVSGIFEKPGEDWERLIGAFLTASFAGLSLEGEFNFGNSGEVASFAPDAVDSKGYYVGARYRLLPQLTLSGRYGLFDPDRTLKGDASQRVTLAAQYNFIENGAISLFYWANLANPDRGPDDTISDKGTLRQLQGTDQIILMSHFWF